ncbi:16S rRNA pseudouridine(516) synthase [Thalassotalea euphylliae]|uniref:16S rRNA pseudouridine(516) synthase n=1 Tax=Thalassotalea euphylliae TaxID=1655234 RepID=UPI00363C5F44
MSISHQRIDKFIAEHCGVSKKAVRLMVAQKRIVVDGEAVISVDQIVNRFSQIALDGEVIQNNQPVYIMLHKPVGVVSATIDEKHKTVIDILASSFDKSICEELHIVGRLDLNTSGLVLLTNDSRWSSALTLPDSKVEKKYRVTLKNKVTEEYVDAFTAGMYFGYEDITTRPATLEIIDEYTTLVTLTEGRYHQIKRMFGRFRNPVVGLHRFAIGNIVLDDKLQPGDSRPLSPEEVNWVI